MLGNLDDKLGIKANVFHIYIMDKLKQNKISGSDLIKRKEAVYIITRHMCMEHVQSFLKELETCGLIKIKDKQNIRIL